MELFIIARVSCISAEVREDTVVVEESILVRLEDWLTEDLAE